MQEPISWNAAQGGDDAGIQLHNSVVALASGGYVTFWQSQVAIDPATIEAQIFDAFGDAVGSQFTVSDQPSTEAGPPAVTALVGGGFLVAWQGGDTDGSSGIRASIYNDAGVLQGGPFAVNGEIDPSTPANQQAPTVTTLSDGSLAVAYASYEQNGDRNVVLQRFDSQGQKLGNEAIVTQLAAGVTLQDIHVNSIGAGMFAVVWAHDGANGFDVNMQRFDNDGTVVGSAIIVAGTAQDQNGGHVALDGNGAILVTYYDNNNSNTDPDSLIGQFFDSNGDPVDASGADLVNSAFEIDTTDLHGTFASPSPTIGLRNGGFLAVWSELWSDGEAIVGQLLASDGSKIGAEFEITESLDDTTGLPSIAELADGRIVVSWTQTDGISGGTSWNHKSIIIDPRGHLIDGTEQGERLIGTHSTVAADTIHGLGGADDIYGLEGDDQLYGGEGADSLSGGSGHNTLDGGNGDDTYYSTSAADVIVENSITGGFDTVQVGLDFTLAAGVHVEKIVLVSANAHMVTGNEFDNIIVGPDTQHDTLVGLGGNDTLIAGNANTALLGGAGDDTYVIGGTNETMTEITGEGTDTVVSNSSYTLIANFENLTLDSSGPGITGTGNALNNKLTGNGLDNVLTGLDGNDKLDGGIGLDTLVGGKGNDTYVLGAEHDVVVDSSGADDVITSTISRKLTSYAGIENLTLAGSGNVSATGNSVANDLNGNAGNNALSGGGGNDLLRGAGGWDRLLGGSGKDRFDFDKAVDIGTLKGARDIIRDFHHGQDRIDLSTIDASSSAGNQAFKFVTHGGSHFTGVKGQLIWDQQNHAGTAHDVTIVSGDINGDHVADFTLELSGIVSLTKGDFVL